MRTIVIRAKCLNEKEEAHAYLKKRLRVADYHGSNLDALYDVLTSLGRETRILVLQPAQAEDYGEKILAVIREAEEANPKLALRLL